MRSVVSVGAALSAVSTASALQLNDINDNVNHADEMRALLASAGETKSAKKLDVAEDSLVDEDEDGDPNSYVAKFNRSLREGDVSKEDRAAYKKVSSILTGALDYLSKEEAKDASLVGTHSHLTSAHFGQSNDSDTSDTSYEADAEDSSESDLQYEDQETFAEKRLDHFIGNYMDKNAKKLDGIPRRTRDKVAKILESMLKRMTKN